MQTIRTFLLIDGNNFYHRLKELQIPALLNFDYEKFAQMLVGKRRLASKRYYIGAIREERNNPKSKTLMINQQRLVGILQKNNWEVHFGHMLKTDSVYHEKGVDILMAVDLLVGAYENLYDSALLVSSDTDLIPALQKVRSMGKKIEYIGFSHQPSYGLITHSDIRRLLTKEDLEPFLKAE